MKNHYVYDWETLSNCAIVCFEHYNTDLESTFIIHKSKNNYKELILFLEDRIKNNEWLIGFNCISFDSQITEYLIKNKKELLDLDGDTLARSIYKKAQEVISKSNAREFQEYPEWKLSIKHVDVFTLNNWQNPAKSSSLKWIQYSMDWFNIKEMPIHHNTQIETEEDINTIINYCQNDVKSTKNITHLCKEEILLRKNLSIEYDLNLLSASEPKLAKELFAFFLSQKTGISKYELKSMRTKRDIINVSDIILSYTEFNTEFFKPLLKKFQDLKVDSRNTKGSFKYSQLYKGVPIEYGLGGVHGARNSGIYESKEGMIIMSSDVVSYYPNLAIRNKWSPAHINKEAFCNQYEWFFNERLKIPKKDPKNYVYKILLNSTFGLSIDEYSFLFDTLFGLQITINGQLSLTMLYEMLCEEIPGSYPLMINTDGLEIMIPLDQKDNYISICKRWEDITKLKLEHDQYKKLILRDINNYIGINVLDKVKCKGVYEYKDLPLHKNKSFLVITKALNEYFVNDIIPEQYLANNRNIFDYCGGAKSKGDWYFLETKVVNGKVEEKKLQKIIRYYISNKGSKIVKHNSVDGRQIQIEAGPWLQTEMNKMRDLQWESYDINEEYYLSKIYKEIANIKSTMSNQLELF